MTALVAHLTARRQDILRAWRTALDRDPLMSTGASLPRAQLDDHVPNLLEHFGQRLCAAIAGHEGTAPASYRADAAAHGLQRWQQGYDLREVTREWGRLQLCVLEELEGYFASHPEVDPVVARVARRVWAELCSEGVSESTVQYFQLQQIEAGGHVRDLQLALEQVQELERQRSELWHQAAHDLRGNLGVVTNVTAGLILQGVEEPARENFLRMLKRNVASLHSLLDDIMNLARLQAGHEVRQVKAFDAAATLRDLCDSMRPLAEERGLFLEADGPAELQVEGDAVKVRRVAQNLLLNALKYTDRGGVHVTWGDSRSNDTQRWMLRVEDTGPGFHAGPGAPMAGALEDATEEARNVERTARRGGADASDAAPLPPAHDSDPRPIHQERGEGIGLSIVKRVCELLNATVEMESTPGEGTIFRIVLPRRYEPTAQPPSHPTAQ